MWADAGQIEQVIVNLVLNARDAMPEGGEVVLALDNLTHTEACLPGDGGLPPGASVCLTVTDEGTGMTPEVAARAVEPFFTTKGTEGGTGLGLATVDRLLRAAGGSLQLESEPGRGTVVRACLPAVPRGGDSLGAAGRGLQVEEHHPSVGAQPGLVTGLVREQLD